MSVLPKEQWLHLAKRLPVGGRSRHLHQGGNCSRRMNLVVGNEGDKYWAYCQSCKLPGVEMKEHVIVTGRQAPKESTLMTVPVDATPLIDCDEATQDAIVSFLASKNMDLLYLPELRFSKSRCRLIINDGDHSLGRDTTGNSPQKWLTYDYARFLGAYTEYGKAVVVEDPFSFYKVAWACPKANVFCSLGTTMHDVLLLELLKFREVMFFYDGDTAGIKGALRESRRLRALGTHAYAKCAPNGMDPKDESVLAIQTHIGG